MARLPRFFVPNTPQHVIQRGNNRTALFVTASDFAFFRRLLFEVSRREGLAVHAYVLMSNHVHLLATPALASSLPRAMQAVGRVYVRYFNETRGRTGTLFEGRYRAALVQASSYLFACMRYIELNPVRAAMVSAPGEYAWSSYASNVSGVADDIVTPHAEFDALADTPARRARAYQAMFGVPLADNALSIIRDATQHAWVVGDAAFQRQVSTHWRRAVRSKPGPRRQTPRADSQMTL